MIDRICIAKDGKTAVITFTDKRNFTVTDDRGLVLDLIIHLLDPRLNDDITYSSYLVGLEDTISIPNTAA